MKTLAIILTLSILFNTPLNADEPTVEVPLNDNSIQSEKLSITFIVLEDSPDYGAIEPDGRYPGKDEFINVKIKFNIDGVKAIIVKDVHAENNKCHRNQVKHSIYLSFAEPEKNQNAITTRISEPCYQNDKAVLKLLVKTTENQRYYNYSTLQRKSSR